MRLKFKPVSTLSNQGMEKSISVELYMLNIGADGLQLQKTTQGAILVG